MIKTPLSTVIGGVGMYTKNTLVIGGHKSKSEPPFDIASLFSSGEQGLFYDPHTLESSLVGQTVPTIPDLSSNNNLGSNANSAQQMLLEVDAITGYKYLKADGVDDHYVTQPIDLGHTDKVTVIAAVKKIKNNIAYPLIVGSGAAGTTQGTFHLYGRSTLTIDDCYALSSVGTNRVMRRTTSNFAAPISSILTAKMDLSALGDAATKLRVNSVDQALTRLDGDATGGGNFGAHQVYIGSRGIASTVFCGDLYGLLIIDRLLTDAEIQKVEAEFAKRMGITL